jgi:regulator of replication initiation timing
MNDIINWIALNNTLMIRIGFSAVVLLLVVYVFRFFFMPSISVVEDAAKADASAAGSDMNIEELAELQAEVDTLKAKLKELQNAGQPKAEPALAASAESGGGVETVSSAPPAAASVDENAAKELQEKIKHLESRLSEYEIIAEEIAEIGKLKQENQKLKEQLESAPKPAPEKAGENPAEDSAVTSPSDKEIDELLGAALEASPEETSDDNITVSGSVDDATEADPALAAEAGAVSEETEVKSSEEPVSEESAPSTAALAAEKPELFILHSDVEVTEEEKELINSFEDYKKV